MTAPHCTHHVQTTDGHTTRIQRTHATHAAAIEHAAVLRVTEGCSCIWIGSKRHGSMLDAIGERMAERTVEPRV